MSDNESTREQQQSAPLVQIAAILFAAIYFIFVAYIAINRTDPSVPSEQWTRIIHLLGGLEAIVFAGAGFLFGREVNRQRADSAENHAAVATSQAEAATAKAMEAEAKATESEKKASDADAKGKALSAAVLSKVEVLDTPAAAEAEGARSRPQTHLHELAAIAKRLYA